MWQPDVLPHFVHSSKIWLIIKVSPHFQSINNNNHYMLDYEVEKCLFPPHKDESKRNGVSIDICEKCLFLSNN